MKLHPPDADVAISAQISKLARWADQPEPPQLGSKAEPGQSVRRSGSTLLVDLTKAAAARQLGPVRHGAKHSGLSRTDTRQIHSTTN